MALGLAEVLSAAAFADSQGWVATWVLARAEVVVVVEELVQGPAEVLSAAAFADSQGWALLGQLRLGQLAGHSYRKMLLRYLEVVHNLYNSYRKIPYATLRYFYI